MEAEPPPQPSVGLYCDDEHLESSRNSNGQHSLGQPSLADDRSFVKYFLILLLAFDAYGRSSSFLPQPSMVNFIYHFFRFFLRFSEMSIQSFRITSNVICNATDGHGISRNTIKKLKSHLLIFIEPKKLNYISVALEPFQTDLIRFSHMYFKLQDQ